MKNSEGYVNLNLNIYIIWIFVFIINDMITLLIETSFLLTQVLLIPFKKFLEITYTLINILKYIQLCFNLRIKLLSLITYI